MSIGHRVAKARQEKAEHETAAADPIDNDALADALVAEMDAAPTPDHPPPMIDADTPAAPPAEMRLTMDQVLQIIAAATATKSGTSFDEAALTRVLMATQQAHATASAQAMQTALNRSNPNYVPKSPYHYEDGREAIPKYTVFFGPQYTTGKGAAIPRDLYSPTECDLINRFVPGERKIARGGEWSAEVLRNGSTEELIIKAPMTTMDQKANLPSFVLMLRELLEGDVAVNPDKLAERVAELERKLAAATVAA